MITGAAALPLAAQEAAVEPSPWGDFVEKDFPFFSSVLDCRELGEGFPKDNLTPRGLILNLGHNVWACYDLDLLRIACIWQGEEGQPPVTPEALAPGSYHLAGQKTKDGQDFLPKPVGTAWLTNGIYPGWQVGDEPVFEDSREPGPSVEEVGRGPLPGGQAQFRALQITSEGVVLVVEMASMEVRTGLRLTPKTLGNSEAEDNLSLEWKASLLGGSALSTPSGKVLSVLGRRSEAFQAKLAGAEKTDSAPLFTIDVPSILERSSEAAKEKLADANKNDPALLFTVFKTIDAGNAVGAGTSATIGTSTFHYLPTKLQAGDQKAPRKWELPFWRESVTTQGQLAKAKPTDAYVVDKIPLPVPNPWKRNVRLADIDFLDDQGNATGVTFDGDVWLISGLQGDLEKVTWRRFASGLHEPMSIVVRKNPQSAISNPQLSDIFVFDRNGIWKLVDTNGDGEADRYEMFCNLFAQTAETREFPNSMKLGPDGSLYISKGGQEGTTRGKHNGTVIKVAPDGKSFEVIGHGLRQPFIGVHPETGLVTASDQQGNWVPSTPLQIIRDNQFYGHLPTVAKDEPYPQTVAEPLVWLPHPVNPSGATQVWATDDRFGPVAGELIHVGYNRPELFRVVMKAGQASSLPESAAVMSFTRNLDFGPLNAKVNPADGQLYVAGFQVWGTTATTLSGLARVRYTGAPRVLMQELTATDKGVILKFNAKLDKAVAEDPANYSAERWNYERTEKYGSPHLKPEGGSGQEWMTASSAYLSADGQSVLVGFPGMKAGVHQMRIGWGLKSADGLPAQNEAYFTPWKLEAFDGEKSGFGKVEVDLTPRAAVTAAKGEASMEEGEKLYQMFGCMACHSIDGTLQGKVGPSWKGLYGSERQIANSEVKKVTADEEYLRESILNPGAKMVKGFEKFDSGMPIYEGILNETQVESLVLYIKSLK